MLDLLLRKFVTKQQYLNYLFTLAPIEHFANVRRTSARTFELCQPIIQFVLSANRFWTTVPTNSIFSLFCYKPTLDYGRNDHKFRCTLQILSNFDHTCNLLIFCNSTSAKSGAIIGSNNLTVLRLQFWIFLNNVINVI